MKAAADSSVVLDILLDDPLHCDRSLALLEKYLGKGSVVICPVAYAESAACLLPPSRFADIAREMGIVYDSFDPEVCILAAQMWRDYRIQGGPKQRLLADFLIGAHAHLRADLLLSRDRGFFRAYFQGLEVVEP
jgi:hypothetical protein